MKDAVIMKRTFQEPDLQIQTFAAEDIIATSSLDTWELPPIDLKTSTEE